MKKETIGIILVLPLAVTLIGLVLCVVLLPLYIAITSGDAFWIMCGLIIYPGIVGFGILGKIN